MDDFIIFKFRDDVMNQIAASDVSELERFQDYGLTMREIALIWMIRKDTEDESKISSFYNFHGLFEQAKKDYITFYNRLAKEQAKTEKVTKAFEKKVRGFDPKTYFPDTTQFTPTKNNMIIDYSGDITLLPTVAIPMFKSVVDTNPGGIYFKMQRGYADQTQLTDFFQGDEGGPEYVFKLPRVEKGLIFTRKRRIFIPVEPSREQTIVNTIAKSFHLSKYKNHKEYINGDMLISGMKFDWNLFAMLLVQRGFYNETIFIAEDGYILSQKNKFAVKYYKYGPEFTPKPVFFSMANVGDDLQIKISKISVDKDIDYMVAVILFLLFEYVEEEEDLIALYKKGVPSFKSIQKPKKIVDKPTKTKQRLEPLKRFDPEVFGGNYKSACQGPTKQPRVPTEKELKVLLRDRPDEVVEFPYGSKKYYTCEPFEKTKGNKINKFPGLVQREGRLMPCCYPVSHHGRPNSLLNKYIAEQSGMGEPIVDKKVSDNILNKDKRLPEFRRGYLSDRLNQILRFIGLNPADYLRYGIGGTEQSIIDAMAAIQDYGKWIENPARQRAKIVSALKVSPMLNAAAQSYSFDYLSDALTSGEGAIGAAEFHPVVEYFFKSTVFVIKGNDIARPVSRFGFIPHLRKRSNMIILFINSQEQVEVIGTYERDFTSYSSAVMNKVLEFKRRCYGFYSPTPMKFPRIAAIANRATHQYVDGFGKNRGFLVDGQTIFCPPSAPVAKPIVSAIYNEDSEAIMAEFRIKPKWFQGGILYSRDYGVPTSEESDLPEPPADFIPPFITTTTDFIKESNKSELKAKNKYVAPLVLDPADVVTIYPQDIDGYMQIVKKLPLFMWERLENLVWSEGKIHWVLHLGEQFTVLDLPYKEADGGKEIGTWNVLQGRKVSDRGDSVVYPGEQYGRVTML